MCVFFSNALWFFSAGNYKIEADTNGVGTGRNTVHLLIGRGDLGAKYECRADNDALEVPYVSSLELDVNGKWVGGKNSGQIEVNLT